MIAIACLRLISFSSEFAPKFACYMLQSSIEVAVNWCDSILHQVFSDPYFFVTITSIGIPIVRCNIQLKILLIESSVIMLQGQTISHTIFVFTSFPLYHIREAFPFSVYTNVKRFFYFFIVIFFYSRQCWFTKHLDFTSFSRSCIFSSQLNQFVPHRKITHSTWK